MALPSISLLMESEEKHCPTLNFDVRVEQADVYLGDDVYVPLGISLNPCSHTNAPHLMRVVCQLSVMKQKQ